MARQKTTRGVPEDIVRRRNRLARYATWTPEELAEVEEAVRAQRLIDHRDAEVPSRGNGVRSKV
jgi:hypothetical protein